MSDIVTPARPDRWRHFVGIVLIFGLAGPPIGLALMTVGAIVKVLVGPHGPHFDPLGLFKNLPEFMQFLIFAVPLSYIVGGVQAFAAGILVAAYGWLIGKPHYWVAALAGLASFGIMPILWPQDTTAGYVSMAAVHIGAALICWHIAKRFWIETT
jgi:hypothetical protein